ncbi:MAG TPA: hypothetical protein ENK18_06435 [Deltaproteobacteria bacterium]|nr:hypothetical protein [Deltaproteobacteria bacterium]
MQIYNKSYQHIDSEDLNSEDEATERMLPEELAELLFDVRAERELAEAERSREREAGQRREPRIPKPPPPEIRRTQPMRRAPAPIRSSGSEILEKFPRPGARAVASTRPVGIPWAALVTAGIVAFAMAACAVVLMT